MEMIDSKQELLNAANIITIAAKDLGTGDIPLPSALASVAKEGTLSSADTVQVGNTVFLAHRGKGKNKNNLVKYFNHLKNKGITHYSAQFNGEKMRNLLNIVGQNIQDIATKFMIARTKQEGTYRVMIAFGSKQ